jgi:AcrR family transcriptional regulator
VTGREARIRAAPRETRDQLLAATEQIVLREGARAVSVRRIAAVSDMNSALISYHFGGLDPLLAQLLERNVDAICDSRATMEQAARAIRGKTRRLEALIIAHLDPLWRTTAIWHPDAARAVVREVMPMLKRPLLKRSVARINNSVEQSALLMSGLLPHLTRNTLLVRLRLLAGAADMMRLRLDQMGLYPLHRMAAAKHDTMMHAQLVQMSLGALRES